MDHPRRAQRLAAFNRYVQGTSFPDIAAELGIPLSTVKRWAGLGKWRDRVEKINQTSLDAIGAVISDEVEKIVSYMRSMLQTRVMELDQACRKGNVTAIIAWMNRSGLPVKGEADEKGKDVIKVRDDLTPTQDAKPPAPPA